MQLYFAPCSCIIVSSSFCVENLCIRAQVADKKAGIKRLRLLKRPASDRYRNLERSSLQRQYQRAYRSRIKGAKQFKASYAGNKGPGGSGGSGGHQSILRKPSAAPQRILQRPSSCFQESYRQPSPCCGMRSYRCKCFASGVGLQIARSINLVALHKVSEKFDRASVRTYNDTLDMPLYEKQMWHRQKLVFLWPYALLWRTFSNGYSPLPSDVCHE